VDDKNEVTTRAKETLRNLYGELTSIEDAEKRQNFARHLTRSECHHHIAGMLKLAESESGIAVSPNALDANHWSLNVLNGTLDLHTGQLRPHGPLELLTKVALVDYDPQAQCPTWDAFLFHVLGEDAELRRFVQKAVGYTLTGSTEEQCLFMLYGSGANGKSTFIQTLSALLGDYARQTPTETLLIKPGDAPRNDLARLQGARFVAAVESESGKRLAEVLVKQLTGGDTITARYLYGEYFDYMPSFKVWLAVNHKPVVQGTDHAIWRRIHVLPFVVTIPEAQRDKRLMEKLQAELPGILRWAVEGCLAWQRERLEAPAVVRRATRDYRAEMDVIAAFIKECCVQGPEQRVGATTLYKEYQGWCSQTGEQVVTQKAFGTALAEQGFTSGRKASERYWQGITLREE